MKDIANTEIKVGDYIAYSTRAGNSSQLKLGEMIEDRGDTIVVRKKFYDSIGRLLDTGTKAYLCVNENIVVTNVLKEKNK